MAADIWQTATSPSQSRLRMLKNSERNKISIKNGAELYFLDPVRRQYSYLGQGFTIDLSLPIAFNVPKKLIYHKLNLRLFNQENYSSFSVRKFLMETLNQVFKEKKENCKVKCVLDAT